MFANKFHLSFNFLGYIDQTFPLGDYFIWLSDSSSF